VGTPSKAAEAPAGQRSPASATQPPPQPPSRNADIGLGGGALDPFSVLAALGLGALASRRRRGAPGP
jgi:hypothetical protein